MEWREAYTRLWDIDRRTPIELAKALIRALYHSGLRAKEGHPVTAVRLRFGILRPVEDFTTAVVHAESLQWIAVTQRGFWNTLTQLGFDQAQAGRCAQLGWQYQLHFWFRYGQWSLLGRQTVGRPLSALLHWILLPTVEHKR